MNSHNAAVSWRMLPVLLAIFTVSYGQEGNNWIDGTLIEFTEGAWCWFQDERAVVDTAEGKLIIGSTNMQSSVDVTIYDIKSGVVKNKKRFNRLDWTDDHNAPAVLVRPDGKYIAMWAHHYDKYNSHYSVFDGRNWSNETTFDWKKTEGFNTEKPDPIAYSNLFYLSGEDKTYNFARANGQSPNFMVSDDYGSTWTFGGRLSTDPSSTYNRGYYKYWTNGIDRIDFCNTQQHPRDTTTSIYHGYIQDGKCHNSAGDVVDENIFDTRNLPTKDDFTMVFEHATKVNGISMEHCWQSDIVRYDDSSIAILFEARADNSFTDHRNFYARYNGSKWDITYIGKAGKSLYPSEEDYTGLGALCPDDPNRIYISSPYNPGDDSSKAGKREIWRGSTGDNGATWTWEPVTANSSSDNFRPIVPKWSAGKEALLWFRGTYDSAQAFTTKIVGVLYEYTVTTEQQRPSTAIFDPGFKTVHDPARQMVTMRYTTCKQSPVRLQLFTVTGKLVATLFSGLQPAGSHDFKLDTRCLQKGMYIARITMDGIEKVSRITVY